MSQVEPEGGIEPPKRRQLVRDEVVKKYHALITKCIADGEKLVPLWRNYLITKKIVGKETIGRWVTYGYFPFIRIGNRRYTADSVIAQWLLDAQSDKTLFGHGYTKQMAQCDAAYQKRRLEKNKRRIALGLPPLPNYNREAQERERLQAEAALREERERAQQPEPMPRKEIIVEGLMPSDEDLYSDPG